MVKSHADTRVLILNAAREMIQARGYNAVSFREIAVQVSIKAASIHYYFPTKERLGESVVQRYRDVVASARDSIDGLGTTHAKRLEHYKQVLSDSFRQSGRMCLCGVLAAESSTLPPLVQAQVKGFFTDNETWLAGVLAAGRRSGEFHFRGNPAKNAVALFAGIEGALMTAWTFADQDRLSFTMDWLFESLLA